MEARWAPDWAASKKRRYTHSYSHGAQRGRPGVDGHGAFYWSLLDNCEWDKGCWPRFGLVEVDRSSLERRPRPSAGLVADILLRHRGSPGGPAPD